MAGVMGKYRCMAMGDDYKRCEYVTTVHFWIDETATKMFQCGECGALNVAQCPPLQVMGPAEYIKDEEETE